MMIKRVFTPVALATALSFSSAGWAQVVDSFDTTQPAAPLVETTVGNTATDSSVAGRSLAVLLTAGTRAAVHINAGAMAHSQDAPSSRGHSRVTWNQATWAGLPQDISGSVAVEVVISEADQTANGLALTINTSGGNATVNRNLPVTVPPTSTVVSFPLAMFGGIDLANVTSMSLQIDGTNIVLDAVVDEVRLSGVVAPPPPIVPVMGGFGVLMTLLGLFGIGRFFSRRKSKA